MTNPSHLAGTPSARERRSSTPWTSWTSQTPSQTSRLYRPRFENLWPRCVASNDEQKRKVPAPKPLKKSKIFPFLQLSAEIRNIIYKYALADASGINLQGAFKHRRRTVERISAEAQSQAQRRGGGYHYRSSQRTNDGKPDGIEEPVVLLPSLLAVCKQIYHESSGILYGNEFIFTDTFALYNFLLNLGPSGSKQLKHVRLLGWGYGRGMKGYNHSCFATLVWATSLETLLIEDTASYSHDPKANATQLYRDAFPWLEAVGMTKGKADAAIDVLQFPPDRYHTTTHALQHRGVVTGKEKEKDFLEQLSKLLYAHQKRLMPPPMKKKKVAKVVDADE
jgi:hypothetical protein